jgi:hypothetical protein
MLSLISGSTTSTSSVFSLGSGSVSGSTFQKGLLGSFNILRLSLPGGKNGLLEGTAVREGKGPWASDLLDLVHGVQVEGSFFLGLTSRKEAHNGESGHNGSAQGTDGHPSDFLGSLSVSAFGTGGNHVGLEHGAFNDELMVNHSLHDDREDVFRNSSAFLNIVGTVNHNFGFNDGDKTIVLANTTIAGESVCSLINRELRRATIGSDLKNSSPLGESASLFVECFAASSETIKTLSGLLSVCASNIDCTLVDFDAGKDSAGSEVLDEVNSILGLFVEGLLEHNDTTDVVVDFRGSEEELTVSASVILSVLNVDSLETLSNGSSALISSEDTLA